MEQRFTDKRNLSHSTRTATRQRGSSAMASPIFRKALPAGFAETAHWWTVRRQILSFRSFRQKVVSRRIWYIAPYILLTVHWTAASGRLPGRNSRKFRK